MRMHPMCPRLGGKIIYGGLFRRYQRTFCVGDTVLQIGRRHAVPVNDRVFSRLVLNDHIETLTGLKEKTGFPVRADNPENLGGFAADVQIALYDSQFRGGRRLG